MPPTSVLIVDDSAVVRQALTMILSAHPDMKVLGAVADPVLALARMRIEWPDVIVLDVEMPRMDGLTFLQRIMAQRPTPVVMCSSVTTAGAAATMQALACGAVGVIGKPRLGARSYLLDASADLVRMVRAASLARIDRVTARAPSPAGPPPAAGTSSDGEPRHRIVAIGASTGGPQALEAVLTALPARTPGIVVVQHMPPQFTAAFALRLHDVCRVDVREAVDGDEVLPGLALIAPGGRHATVRRSGGGWQIQVRDGPLVHHHRPSVDVLFRSVASAAGPHALGILMTGMGADGAAGLKAMRDAGASTIAQDEASSVVFGMPREAIRLGAAQRVLPLRTIAAAIARR